MLRRVRSLRSKGLKGPMCLSPRCSNPSRFPCRTEREDQIIPDRRLDPNAPAALPPRYSPSLKLRPYPHASSVGTRARLADDGPNPATHIRPAAASPGTRVLVGVQCNSSASSPAPGAFTRCGVSSSGTGDRPVSLMDTSPDIGTQNGNSCSSNAATSRLSIWEPSDPNAAGSERRVSLSACRLDCPCVEGSRPG